MKRSSLARERVWEIREKEVKGEEESLNLVNSWVPHKVKIFEFWE